jgi:hypothetical protein
MRRSSRRSTAGDGESDGVGGRGCGAVQAGGDVLRVGVADSGGDGGAVEAVVAGSGDHAGVVVPGEFLAREEQGGLAGVTADRSAHEPQPERPDSHAHNRNDIQPRRNRLIRRYQRLKFLRFHGVRRQLQYREDDHLDRRMRVYGTSCVSVLRVRMVRYFSIG